MKKKQKTNRTTWTVWDKDNVVHVIPDDDCDVHIFHKNCKCKPRIAEAGHLIVHNAFDKREYFEEGTTKVLPLEG